MAADVTENEAEKRLSSDAALEELIAGNRRFTSGRTSSHRRDLAMLQQMMEKQEPFAAVLSCADSRVPVEVVFDQTIGQLFVTRVAGNIVTAGDRGQSRVCSRGAGNTTRSWSWAIAVAVRSRRPSRNRRQGTSFPGRSARCSPIFSRRWSRPAPMWRPPSAPMH